MEHVPEFLADDQILARPSEALKIADGADLAIAYWGVNAARTLGIDMIKGPVRILCDVYSMPGLDFSTRYYRSPSAKDKMFPPDAIAICCRPFTT